MVDLGDHGGEVVVHPGVTAAVAVQQVLGRAAERACRRDRLIDLVGERGGHAADEIEAGGLIRFRFLGAEQRLDLADRAVGLLAFVHGHADGQPGGGQQQHQDLEFGEHVGVIAVEVQEPDQAELGEGEAEARAVEPVTDRRHHDRQEEQIEQLEAALALGQADEPQEQQHDRDVERDLRRERPQRLKRYVRDVEDEAQDQRRHHRDADRVADEQRSRCHEHVGEAELLVGDQQQ